MGIIELAGRNVDIARHPLKENLTIVLRLGEIH